MDLLDSITSMMDRTIKQRPRPKPGIKVEPSEASNQQAPAPSFRIPKKKRGVSPPNDAVKQESPLSRSSSHSSNRHPSGDYSRSSCRIEEDSKYGVREVYKTEPRDSRDYGAGMTIKREYKPSIGAGTSGQFAIPRTLPIEMNGLNLDTTYAPECVDRYHITIVKILRNKEKDATTGPKEDLPTQYRRRSLFAIFKQLVRTHPEEFGDNRYKHVYDLGNTFYSIGCNITEERGEVVFKIPAEEIGSDFAKKFLSRGGLKELVITVQWTGRVYIKGSKQNEDDGTRREAARFFDVLTSQILFHGDHFMFGNRFFEKQVNHDANIGDGKCVKSGFEKNVRFLGDSQESAAPVLQIDTKKSPFYSEQPVLDFIKDLAKGKPPEEALRHRAIKSKVIKELRGLVVTTTHNNRTLYIQGIAEKNATNQFFSTNEGDLSVEKYFYEQYHLQLRHPTLPLATERNGTRSFNYYPLEVLKIERGQRVNSNNLAGVADKMIQQARILPHEMRAHNQYQLRNGRLTTGDNAYLDAFGVRTDGTFVTSEAKVLSAPEIKYKTASLQPDKSGPMLHWRMKPGCQFFRGAEVRSVSLVIFDEVMRNEEAMQFYHSLARAGRDRGMTVSDDSAKVTHLASELDEQIELHFRSCLNKVSMILCITQQKKDPVHDTIKMLEAKYNILTQHISKDTAVACSKGGGAKTLENVLLKFNAKNKGLNHTISIPRVALGRGAEQRDMNAQLFHAKMFVGFELSHAAAQCLFDRQNSIAVSEPTVVGFSYSIGEPTDYSGFYWYQQPRLHTVQYISHHFGRAFVEYQRQNKRLPAEVFVYRSGTSEGEFSEVAEEVNEIRAVARGISRELNNGRPYNPKITVVVAQAKSNYRMLPTSLPAPDSGRYKAQELNVPSGTCADTGIVNPQYREFIMTSQQANIGTSKPCRYTIVYEDEPHSSKDDIEHITHFLCHGHQQSTLPTHIPAVLYAAENLAKRGRAAWKTKSDENSDDASSSSSGRILLRDGESAEEFYTRISNELMNSLPNHYFA